MNIRTSIIAASLAVALIAATGAFAASQSPAHNHAVATEQTYQSGSEKATDRNSLNPIPAERTNTADSGISTIRQR